MFKNKFIYIIAAILLIWFMCSNRAMEGHRGRIVYDKIRRFRRNTRNTKNTRNRRVVRKQ